MFSRCCCRDGGRKGWILVKEAMYSSVRTLPPVNGRVMRRGACLHRRLEKEPQRMFVPGPPFPLFLLWHRVVPHSLLFSTMRRLAQSKIGRVSCAIVTRRSFSSTTPTRKRRDPAGMTVTKGTRFESSGVWLGASVAGEGKSIKIFGETEFNLLRAFKVVDLARRHATKLRKSGRLADVTTYRGDIGCALEVTHSSKRDRAPNPHRKHHPPPKISFTGVCVNSPAPHMLTEDLLGPGSRAYR